MANHPHTMKGLGLTYNGGGGSNDQFYNRIPDYIENNGLANKDYLISPDTAPVYYNPGGGITITITLNFSGLGTLLLIPKNNMLKQFRKAINKIK